MHNAINTEKAPQSAASPAPLDILELERGENSRSPTWSASSSISVGSSIGDVPTTRCPLAQTNSVESEQCLITPKVSFAVAAADQPDLAPPELAPPSKFIFPRFGDGGKKNQTPPAPSSITFASNPGF
jgi:hypothetical protein